MMHNKKMLLSMCILMYIGVRSCARAALHFPAGNILKDSSCGSLWTSQQELNISSGQYIKLDTRRTASYDHMSCFTMKSRYNCAHADPKRASVLDWKFNLKTATGENCDPGQMFENSGGILQLAQNIRSWSGRTNDTHTNILITGDSLLRQVWESITCTYRQHIVGGFLYKGPGISMEAWHRHQSTVNDMGVLVSLDAMRDGCHAFNHTHYYESGVPLPHQVSQNCSDDVSMVDLPGGLRIYYTFRLAAFDADLSRVLRKMQLDPTELDVIVTNKDPWTFQEVHKLAGSDVPIFRVGHLVHYFRKVMERDVGTWFGADNVGIYEPPDMHPCMPGVPDDETNLILFSLAHKLFLHQGV